MDSKKISLDRREFMKRIGLGGAVAGLALSGCNKVAERVTGGAHVAAVDVPDDMMTFRTNHNTGDRVSLLGYGMMRLPTVNGQSGRESDSGIDQDAVNELVDYALAHGVNYFDTSPMYCKGKSEEATGIALSRHPRDSYFIATKLSNFAPSTWPLKESVKMFETSLRLLRTDYVDYLLLHAVGGGGIPTLNDRFIDNGLLDFLIKERGEGGRIRNLGFSFHGDVEVFDHLLAMHDAGDVHWDFVQIQHNYVDWHNREGNAKRSEYLYGELEKRHIPAVVMEPLLGGRLSHLPDHLAGTLRERRPDRSLASWAFRFAGTHPGILTVLSG
ncbi:MAG: aldo/keto reductase, partial [Muribaculaceae bacterium]|nr:aldo/keto reductase [Muribaculaceae bacterium]